MKRIILFLLLLFVISSLISTASAETVTFHENLALALQSADILGSDGSTITAEVTSSATESSDVVTVSLTDGSDDVPASSVAVIDFGKPDCITSADFESFDVFTGLEELTIALPDTFSGEFLPSFDKLSLLDVSGSTADFILSLYKSVNVISVDAEGCTNLKAVNLALVQAETVSSDSSSSSSTSGLGMLGGQTKSELLSSPLTSLVNLNLSNCPQLDRIGYALSTGAGFSFPGMGGGTSGGSSGISSMLGGGGGSSIPMGYKTHTVITALRNGTIYLHSDMSHSNSQGFNIMQMLMGGEGDEITAYKGGTVNLVPALETLNLKDSGTDSEDYISFIDIPEMAALSSADFSGMTRLNYVSLPSGTTLKTLNLTGDTALLALDLSDTKGFTWPEGFKTLTGLLDFRMAGRNEIGSADVSMFTKLLSLDMTGDSLEALDLSSNTVLENLYVGNNYLYSLDMSAHTTLKHIDARNNRLVKIDLSKNLGLKVNYNSPENSSSSLSSQIRIMTGNRPSVFSFRDLGMSSLEYANIVPESVKGEGVSVTEYDPLSGTMKFSSLPSVVTYDYMSGIYYEGDTRPFCMNVRLLWDVSGMKPVLSPAASVIHGQADAGAVTPVTITADSETPVTWTTDPANMPAGLVKSSTGWTLTISGEPSEAYTGTVTVTARNENGVSEPATVSIVIDDPYAKRPEISPLISSIVGRVNSGHVLPVIITAESKNPVTWSTSPDIMPAGLVKIPGTRTLVISGEPDSIYSGIVTVTAENEYGISLPAEVSIDIEAALEPLGVGSSGGCISVADRTANIGHLSLAVISIAFAMMLRKQ